MTETQIKTSCVCTKSLQSYPTLGYVECSPLASSVHGTLQARILKWVAISPQRNLPNPGIEPASLNSSALANKFFTTSST